MLCAIPITRFTHAFVNSRSVALITDCARKLLLVAAVIVFVAAGNAAATLYFWDSPRAEGVVSFSTRTEYFKNIALPRSVFPNLLIINSKDSIVVLASGITLLCVFLFIVYHHKKTKTPHKFSILVSLTLVASLGTILTSLPIALVPDSGMDFRRYWFSSIVASLIVLSFAISFLRWSRQSGYFWLGPILAALFTSLLISNVLTMKSMTSLIPKKEWRSAKCASANMTEGFETKIVLNSQDLASSGYLNKPSDEFEVATLLRPIAGSMMVWTSARGTLISKQMTNPWEIEIRLSNEPSTLWGSRFIQCFSLNK